ncbi:hypothetical protein GGTG_07300 [Gaeumannomyces tritici R3-111a-1]|uniref:Transmembrane protein n=1 Tax=Gaeumannomyces tritici (strain R3-111a-1) TaxID=644352 RepID=J3P1A3_GAET3|nr:hypothetical protein GGTG_07300 [Gaeumannomyces tritici R3-111a-1]EJT77388.1 hypothetical protein GGTG_07300 [Gaeumannomyces tritici R3-111a-1]
MTDTIPGRRTAMHYLPVAKAVVAILLAAQAAAAPMPQYGTSVEVGARGAALEAREPKTWQGKPTDIYGIGMKGGDSSGFSTQAVTRRTVEEAGDAEMEARDIKAPFKNMNGESLLTRQLKRNVDSRSLRTTSFLVYVCPLFLLLACYLVFVFGFVVFVCFNCVASGVRSAKAVVLADDKA